MRTRAVSGCALATLALLFVGCAQGGVDDLPFAAIASDTDELERGCDGVLDRLGGYELGWVRLADDKITLVIDGAGGSCIDDRQYVIEILTAQRRLDIVAQIVAGFVAADPSPHPDLNSADPSPHPDNPIDSTSADPSPHPDANSSADDDDDDVVSFWVVIQLGGGGGSSGGVPSGPAPSPRAPTDD